MYLASPNGIRIDCCLDILFLYLFKHFIYVLPFVFFIQMESHP